MAKLYFRYGAMNCGKSTHLLQVAHNYEELGMRIMLVKPSTDTKAGDRVSSRLGVERPVDVLLAPDEGLLDKLREGITYLIYRPNAILVDEAQFLTPNQVDELWRISKVFDIPVICYGLRCDFQMKGFPGATRLLEIADDIEEMKTMCKCGSKATQNIRLVNGEPVFDGNQVAIDGKENVTYQAVCGKCYIRKKEGGNFNGR